ncbi:MAG: DUF1343 domain-containing protein [Myxococcales bacterium]|nr:DUF1343 domain-containing protein [Myxococcales bacterium]
MRLRLIPLVQAVLLIAAPAWAKREGPTYDAFAGRDPWPSCTTQPLPSARPSAVGIVDDLTADLDALLRDALRRKIIPAAQLVVVRRGRVVYRRAVGGAKLDTIFDLASVTKVVATVTSVLQLVERGKLRLDDPVAKHLRWLGPDKRSITVRQLLLHISGLHSVVAKGDLTFDPKIILRRIKRSRVRAAPGTRVKYSDAGFILLAALVEKLSGKRFDRYVRSHILAPLGMCSAGFAPPRRVRARLITPWPRGRWKHKDGIVYDPLSERMRGIAGHAGLYATADDLARFGLALLRGGKLANRRVLSRASIRAMTQRHALPGGRTRGLGWIVSRSGRFGHTGFTGTSIFIDPRADTVVVLLTNRTYLELRKDVHPSVSRLRRRVHALVRGALLRGRRRRGGRVRVGLDVLVAEKLKRLHGRRVALVTNRTAIDARGRWIGEIFDAARDVSLVALFAPEHGLSARVDRRIRDGKWRTPSGRSVPVYSLFGRRQRPTSKTLAGVDTIVFDVAAIGVRYYTYIATMGWSMRAAARHKLRFVVLDRPNPLGAVKLSGPVARYRLGHATRYHALPVRYGMTMGELSLLLDRERRIGAKPEVIKVRGWRRAQRFDRQGLRWVNPSPNIRSWRQALTYGAVGLVEGTNVAVGRGTDSPFLWLGAPWIDGVKLARALNALGLAGAYFVPEARTPRSSRHRRKRCDGVRLLLLDAARFDVGRTGAAIALALRRLFAAHWHTAQLIKLVADPSVNSAILAGKPLSQVVALWRQDLRAFAARRRRYLLYR